MAIEHLQIMAREWLEALLCAASSGDAKANAIYRIAKLISSGEEVNAQDCDAFESYCTWVKQTSGEDHGAKQYAWCEGCNDVLLPIGKTCKCGTVNV